MSTLSLCTRIVYVYIPTLPVYIIVSVPVSISLYMCFPPRIFNEQLSCRRCRSWLPFCLRLFLLRRSNYLIHNYHQQPTYTHNQQLREKEREIEDKGANHQSSEMYPRNRYMLRQSLGSTYDRSKWLWRRRIYLLISLQNPFLVLIFSCVTELCLFCYILVLSNYFNYLLHIYLMFVMCCPENCVPLFNDIILILLTVLDDVSSIFVLFFIAYFFPKYWSKNLTIVSVSPQSQHSWPNSATMNCRKPSTRTTTITKSQLSPNLSVATSFGRPKHTHNIFTIRAALSWCGRSVTGWKWSTCGSNLSINQSTTTTTTKHYLKMYIS